VHLQTAEAEQRVLQSIADVTGRGKSGLTPAQQSDLEEAVAQLEAEVGCPNPTQREDLLNGKCAVNHHDSDV
jgi:PAP_fibrillin